MKQYVSSEYGTGAGQKTRLFDILTNDEKTEETIAKGHKLLALA